MSDAPADREVSAVASRRRQLDPKWKLGAAAAGSVAVVCFIFWWNPGQKEPPEPKPTTDSIRQTVSYEGPPAPPTTPPPAATPPAQALPPPAAPSMAALGVPAGNSKAPDPGTRLYSYAAPSGSNRESGETNHLPEAPTTSVAFKGAAIPGGKAGRALDQTYMLMPGIHLCVLEVAIQSDLPGAIFCHLKDDALSPRNVVLMRAGTRITGEYKNNVANGQSRIFTMAGFAITPEGVPVPLDAPMGDGLGRAGIEGSVDNHYPERFGGAVLLTLLDTTTSLAQSYMQSNSRNGNSQFNFNSGGNGMQSLAGQVLQKQIDIPPTITVNHGEVVSITIRYPIDFSDSYKLRNRH